MDPPQLEELEHSPPESVKKARLASKTGSGAAPETCLAHSASPHSSSPSSAIAAAASRLAACGKAPCLWSADEVVEFMGKSGVPENVVDAFKGRLLAY